jgi:hypothetical protein
MKVYEFNISQVYINKFFKPIRSKAEVIEVLMEAIRYMLLNPHIEEENKVGKIILKIDKMNRLFFFTDGKYFSIVFPFFAIKEDKNYLFSFKNKIEIDSRLISQVISIIKCDEFKAHCSLDFVAPICEYEEDCDENFWIFLRELLLMEDGYIRYDYDEENYHKFKKRGEEHKHPLNHYDLFYFSHATFKLGLNTVLSEDEFIDLLDINSDCKYLG